MKLVIATYILLLVLVFCNKNIQKHVRCKTLLMMSRCLNSSKNTIEAMLFSCVGQMLIFFYCWNSKCRQAEFCQGKSNKKVRKKSFRWVDIQWKQAAIVDIYRGVCAPALSLKNYLYQADFQKLCKFLFLPWQSTYLISISCRLNAALCRLFV